MSNDLKKITKFINTHHVMSLATTYENELSVCSLFYVYDEITNSFIIASSEKTTHIRHIKNNTQVAGNILLETEKLLKIQGLQFRGTFVELNAKREKKLYFEKFPYSLALKPKLWSIKVNYFKMTDNKMGFAKKIILSDFSL